MKAVLQGFKEFVQTGIPITAGSIVRINGKLEVGTLSESVTVTTEAVILKTDKADISTDLRPEDVTNLPLNQYRNYQYLMNLVPGATPPEFQNAQTDTPARSLSVNVNGTNRNNNVTRIDGAASINVWLPHHAGYVAPVETIENVNISTNSFDSAQGMTGGAAAVVQTKSGTNTFKGSAFFFRQQDELNARRGYFDPAKVDSSTSIMGGTAGGPVRRNKLFYFGSWERTSGHLQHLQRADRENAPGRLQRSAGVEPELPHLGPRDGDLRRQEPYVLRRRDHSCQPHQPGCSEYPGSLSGTQRGGHQQRTAGERQDSPQSQGRPRQLRLQGELEPDDRASDLGQVLDDEGEGVRSVLHSVRRSRWRSHQDDGVYRRSDMDAHPDTAVRCQRRCELDAAELPGP
jgi:hypothetical protein